VSFRSLGCVFARNYCSITAPARLQPAIFRGRPRAVQASAEVLHYKRVTFEPILVLVAVDCFNFPYLFVGFSLPVLPTGRTHLLIFASSHVLVGNCLFDLVVGCVRSLSFAHFDHFSEDHLFSLGFFDFGHYHLAAVLFLLLLLLLSDGSFHFFETSRSIV
jgi:hypothetical protein